QPPPPETGHRQHGRRRWTAGCDGLAGRSATAVPPNRPGRTGRDRRPGRTSARIPWSTDSAFATPEPADDHAPVRARSPTGARTRGDRGARCSGQGTRPPYVRTAGSPTPPPASAPAPTGTPDTPR